MQDNVLFANVGDFYEISSNGEIFGKERVIPFVNHGVPTIRKRKRFKLKPRVDKDGYLLISIYSGGVQKNFRIHRLLGEAFIPNPDNKEIINHKNGIKSDNRLSNLEWATHSENCLHAFKTGLSRISDNCRRNSSLKHKGVPKSIEMLQKRSVTQKAYSKTIGNLGKITLNIETGIYYKNIRMAAESLGFKIDPSSLGKMLNGKIKNTTPIIFV